MYIHDTGELLAKRITPQVNSDTLILRTTGGDIPDREVFRTELEIRGVVTDFQRSLHVA